MMCSKKKNRYGAQPSSVTEGSHPHSRWPHHEATAEATPATPASTPAPVADSAAAAAATHCWVAFAAISSTATEAHADKRLASAAAASTAAAADGDCLLYCSKQPLMMAMRKAQKSAPVGGSKFRWMVWDAAVPSERDDGVKKE